MKINKRKKSNIRKILYISIFILIFIVLLMTIFEFTGITSFFNKPTNDSEVITDNIQDNTDTTDDSDTGDTSELPQKTTDTDDSGTTISDSKSNIQTPTTPPEKPYLSRAEQTSQGLIKAVATFQQESLGYCELQLSKSGQQTVSREAYIVIGSSYYSCSFSMNDSNLAKGQWNAAIIHHIGDASTSSDVEYIEVY